MEFLTFGKAEITDRLNQEMRCVVRVALMVKGMKRKDIASAICRDDKGFCNWLHGRIAYGEKSFRALLDYFAKTYPDDIEVILRWAEELYCYEQRNA